MTEEIWKEIPQRIYWLGIKPIYEASNMGRIRNKKTKKILKQSPFNGNNNRLRVQLRGNYSDSLSFRVSYIIYETFRNENDPSSYEQKIYFKDGNCHNFAFNNLSITKI